MTPLVTVIGAGIVGASVAWHLARAGARVTLVDRARDGRGGATVQSFGWIGTSGGWPSDDPGFFALQAEALRDFARMEAELGRGLRRVAQGALVWGTSPEQTLALVAEQRAAGLRVEALSREGIAALEPDLVAPPILAAHAPADFAVEPAELAHLLASAARAAGAEFLTGAEVIAIETRGGWVSAVRTRDRVIPTDVAVLAAGTAIPALCAPLGIDLPVEASPAVLIRLDREGPGPRCILSGPDIELRSGGANGLVSAADFPDNGDSGLPALAEATMAAAGRMFGPVRPRSIAIGARPWTGSGRPISNIVPGIEGLFVTVGHPGVMFSGWFGRTATARIMGWS